MKRRQLVVINLLIIALVLSSLCLAQTSRRDKYIQPEKVMKAIGVKKGMVIGEAGAGRGYLTFKLSKKVGKTGRIYANDINKKVLQSIESQCKKEQINNITTVVGGVTDPLFPVKNLDMIIMINAFHDFEKKNEWLENVKQYMKQGAPLVIIEGHDDHTKLNKKIMIEIGDKAGYKLVQYETFLPEDFVYVFKLVQ